MGRKSVMGRVLEPGGPVGQLTPQPVHSRQALLTLEEQHSGTCKQATLLPGDFKQDPCPTDGQEEAEKDKGKAAGCCWEPHTTGGSSRQGKEPEK